jgi:hypothetical protein
MGARATRQAFETPGGGMLPTPARGCSPAAPVIRPRTLAGAGRRGRAYKQRHRRQDLAPRLDGATAAPAPALLAPVSNTVIPSANAVAAAVPDANTSRLLPIVTGSAFSWPPALCPLGSRLEPRTAPCNCIMERWDYASLLVAGSKP